MHVVVFVCFVFSGPGAMNKLEKAKQNRKSSPNPPKARKMTPWGPLDVSLNFKRLPKKIKIVCCLCFLT